MPRRPEQVRLRQRHGLRLDITFFTGHMTAPTGAAVAVVGITPPHASRLQVVSSGA